MSEVLLESPAAASTNGGTDPLGLDPKATVLAPDDALSGKLVLKGSGQVLGNFSGQIECFGDLLIGPEAHVEADIKGTRITVSGPSGQPSSARQSGEADCPTRTQAGEPAGQEGQSQARPETAAQDASGGSSDSAAAADPAGHPSAAARHPAGRLRLVAPDHQA